MIGRLGQFGVGAGRHFSGSHRAQCHSDHGQAECAIPHELFTAAHGESCASLDDSVKGSFFPAMDLHPARGLDPSFCKPTAGAIADPKLPNLFFKY